MEKFVRALTSSEPSADPRWGRVARLLLLALAAWAGVYARVALGPLQETMRSALALSDNEIATLVGPATGLAVMLGSIPLGLLIDRYSRVRLIVLFVVLDLVGSVLTALASDFVVLFAARCIVGLAAVGSLIAAFSLIADLYAPEQRGRATMVVAGGADLAFPAAFALGGALLVVYGADPDGWRWAILWMTGPPLVLVVLLMLGLREPPRTGLIVKNIPIRAAFPQLWRYRSMAIPLLIARAMVGMADGATLVWAAPFFARSFQLPPDRIGAIMAVVLLVAGLVASVTGGLAADLCHRTGGPRRTMRVMGGLALLSLPAGLFSITPEPVSASILLITFIVLGFTANTAGAALSTIVIPNELRGTFFSMSMVTGAFFGAVLAPLLVSSLAGAIGGPAMIGTALAVVCVAFSMLGAATFIFGSRSFPKKSAA